MNKPIKYDAYYIYDDDDDFYRILDGNMRDISIKFGQSSYESFDEAAQAILDNKYKEKDQNIIHTTRYPKLTTMKMLNTKYKNYRGNYYVLKNRDNQYVTKDNLSCYDINNDDVVVYLDRETALNSTKYRSNKYRIIELNK